MSPRGRRLALAGGAALALVVVALVVIQLVAPPIAERRLRERLQRSGRVERVEIGAFPAVKLLWGSADDVVVRMRDAQPGPGGLADLLARARDTERLDARVGSLRVLTLRLRDVRLRERDAELTGSATVTEPDLRAALPPGFDVRPIASGGGTLVLEGSAVVLGQRLSARAVVAARDGKLVIAPELPFGGLLSLTLFADPRVAVTDVSARPAAGGGFTLRAAGRATR